MSLQVFAIATNRICHKHVVISASSLLFWAMFWTTAYSAELSLETILALTEEDRQALGFEKVVEECTRILQQPDALTSDQRAKILLERGTANGYLGRSGLTDIDAALSLHPSNLTAQIHRAEHWVGREAESIEELNRIATNTVDLRVAAHAGLVLASWRTLRGEHEVAIAELSRAISNDPSCYVLYKNLAAEKYDAGDYRGCLEDINRAIAMNPLGFYTIMGRNAYRIRGLARFQLGDDAGAHRDFEVAVGQQPRKVEHRFSAYSAFSETGKTGLAYLAASGLLTDFPKEERALPVFRHAIADLLGAEAALPRAPQDLFGQLEIDIDDYERTNWIPSTPTIKYVSRVFAEDTELSTERRVELLRRRAAAYQRGKQMALAEQDLREALRLAPDNVNVMYRLARLLAPDPARYPDCESVIQALLERDPGHAGAYLARAFSEYAWKRPSAALRAAERALELQAEFPEAQALRGLLKSETGDLPGALADMDHAIQQDPLVRDGRAHMMRAQMLVKAGRFPEAIGNAVFTRSLSKSVLPRRLLCHIYLDYGKKEIAAVLADQLEAELPDDPETKPALAEIRARLR